MFFLTFIYDFFIFINTDEVKIEITTCKMRRANGRISAMLCYCLPTLVENAADAGFSESVTSMFVTTLLPVTSAIAVSGCLLLQLLRM